MKSLTKALENEVAKLVKPIAEYTHSTECGEAGVVGKVFPRWIDYDGDLLQVTKRMALELSGYEYSHSDYLGTVTTFAPAVTMTPNTIIVEQVFNANV